jgi:hypothetical protein
MEVWADAESNSTHGAGVRQRETFDATTGNPCGQVQAIKLDRICEYQMFIYYKSVKNAFLNLTIGLPDTICLDSQQLVTMANEFRN